MYLDLYTKNFLPGPFHTKEYRKDLPFFLSQNEKKYYNKSLKSKSNDWKYRTKEIRYDLNNDNYRTVEWENIDWKDSVVVFGCSHVFGEGLAIDETMCYHLENIINKRVVNLGQPGTSTFFSWHNSLILDKLFDAPYAVIQMWSSISRLCYYSYDKIKRIGHWSGNKWDNYDIDAKHMFDLWNSCDLNPAMQFYFTALSSRNYWKSKCKYIEASLFDDTARVLEIEAYNKIDNARDDIHFGNETQMLIARDLANQLQKV